jgi:hypothetical protein
MVVIENRRDGCSFGHLVITKPNSVFALATRIDAIGKPDGTGSCRPGTISKLFISVEYPTAVSRPAARVMDRWARYKGPHPPRAHFGFERGVEEIALAHLLDLEKVREVIDQSTPEEIWIASNNEDSKIQKTLMAEPGFVTDAEDMLFDMDKVDARARADGILLRHRKDTIRHYGRGAPDGSGAVSFGTKPSVKPNSCAIRSSVSTVGLALPVSISRTCLLVIPVIVEN